MSSDCPPIGNLPSRPAATQLRVIAALILREMRTRFGRSQLGYVWALVEPIAYITLLSTIFILAERKAYFGDNIAVFFATGVTAFLLWRKLAGQLSTAFISNRPLFTFPIVTELDALFARAILETVTAIVIYVVVFTGICLILDIHPPARIGHFAAAFLATVMLGFGFGTINAVGIALFGSWSVIESIITRPMFIISGVFFPISAMPESVQEILLWNPLLHAIEWTRYGFYSNYRADHLDIAYLLWWGAGMTVLGLAGERALRLQRQT